VLQIIGLVPGSKGGPRPFAAILRWQSERVVWPVTVGYMETLETRQA
jgi:hypothetical protein